MHACLYPVVVHGVTAWAGGGIKCWVNLLWLHVHAASQIRSSDNQDVTTGEGKQGGRLGLRKRISVVAQGRLAWFRYHNDVGNLEIIQR